MACNTCRFSMREFIEQVLSKRRHLVDFLISHGVLQRHANCNTCHMTGKPRQVNLKMAPTGDAVDFKTRFYNLNGDTLKERKKEFYTLLHSTPKTLPEDELEFEPRNFLESLYKVEALIYFHKSQQLLKVLKEGNIVFASKIVKQRWFCEEVFSFTNEELFVNDVLPSYSFSLRMKILKKVTSSINDEARMDKFFDCIFRRYGLFIAAQFLSGCSREKIENVITNNVVELSSNQLKIIFDKDSNLISLYFRELKNNDNELLTYYLKGFYVYVAQKDPGFFLKFRDEFIFGIKLGRRTTKGLIKIAEPEITKDVNKYVKILNTSIMSRKLRNFDQVIAKEFPDKVEAIYFWQIEKYINTYPIKKRWTVFAQIFNRIYGQDVMANLVYLTEEFIAWNPQIRSTWAEHKYKKTNEVSYLANCEPKYAIPLLKEKITLTSAQRDRGDLVIKLVKTCLTYGDLSSLEQVLGYICTRHRNEEEHIRDLILNELKQSTHIKNLNDQHWKYINDLLTIKKARKESSHIQLLIKHEYIEYLYTNKKDKSYELCAQYVKGDVQEIIDSFVIKKRDLPVYRDILTDLGMISAEVECEDKLDAKIRLLEKICSFNEANPTHKVAAPELDIFKDTSVMVSKNPHEYSREQLRYLTLLLKFNLENPEKGFPLPEGASFVNFLDSILENKNVIWDIFSSIFSMIQKTKRSSVEDKILHLVFTKYLTNILAYDSRFIEYFLINEPRSILPFLDQILNEVCIEDNTKLGSFNMSYIRKYSFLELDQKIIEHLKTVLIKFKPENKIKVLQPLSLLMSTEDFVKLILPFVPKEIKLDLDNEEQLELYHLQCEIVKTLKNILEPIKICDLLVKFCQGDYLQSSLPTLYKVLYRCPETEVVNYVNLLAQRAVSVRKHALFLACQILSIEIVENMYLNTIVLEKNSSNLKNWFTSVLKYFIRNPSDHLLTTIMENLNKINENDDELLRFTTQVKIPKKFQPIYIEKIWKALEELKKQQNAICIEKHQSALLTKIDLEMTPKFGKDFLKNIIENYFLISDQLDCQMDSIVINYLATYVQDEEFKFVFKCIAQFKEKHWRSNENTFNFRVFQFFDNVCGKLFKVPDQLCLKFFKEHWEKVFTNIESFKEHFTLKLMISFKEDLNMTSFAQKVNNLLKELQHLYQVDGMNIVELVKKSFEQFESTQKSFDVMEFVLNLITIEKNLTNMLFAIWQLFKNYPYNVQSISGKNVLTILIDEKNLFIQTMFTSLQKT